MIIFYQTDQDAIENQTPFDAGPTLYKYYTNVLCLLGSFTPCLNKMTNIVSPDSLSILQSSQVFVLSGAEKNFTVRVGCPSGI